MPAKVSLREVVDALELAHEEMSSYANKVTGQVIPVMQENLSLAEGGDEDEIAGLADWQREAVAEARQVLESDDWVKLPDKFEIHEWEIMNDFGASLDDGGVRAEIANAIRGSGAFRNFKALTRRLGLEQRWFDFRLKALEDIARRWLASHGLEIDDRPVAERAEG